jgi:hypothetical protein
MSKNLDKSFGFANLKVVSIKKEGWKIGKLDIRNQLGGNLLSNREIHKRKG